MEETPLWIQNTVYRDLFFSLPLQEFKCWVQKVDIKAITASLYTITSMAEMKVGISSFTLWSALEAQQEATTRKAQLEKKLLTDNSPHPPEVLNKILVLCVCFFFEKDSRGHFYTGGHISWCAKWAARSSVWSVVSVLIFSAQTTVLKQGGCSMRTQPCWKEILFHRISLSSENWKIQYCLWHCGRGFFQIEEGPPYG